MDTRETALLLFVEMEKTKNFGSSLIRDTLNKYDYEDPREKAFLKRLTEGTLESLLTLDYVINAYSKTPTNKMKPLIRSLLLDETFSALSLAERTAVQQRILTEIKGRMLEDIVLLETKLENPKKQVFVLQFPVGEFDMVVFDPEAGSCRIFEIKHSEEAVPQQYRHLIDEQKCAQTEHRYGPITGKFVLYRGKSQVVEDIQYQNVEEYLRNLA